MSTSDELGRIWLFEGLTEDQLNSLSPFTYRKNFGPGEVIVEEGHTGNGLYLVVSGNVEAIKGMGTEQHQVVNKMGAGEVFGEMALVDDEPRIAALCRDEIQEIEIRQDGVILDRAVAWCWECRVDGAVAEVAIDAFEVLGDQR